VPDIDDPASLRSDSIWSLHLDDQGILWIGTFDGGVNYLCLRVRDSSRSVLAAAG